MDNPSARHCGRGKKYRGLCAFVGFALLGVACSEVGLEPRKRGGSTLPVPDLTKVSYSFELTTGQASNLVVTGEDGAIDTSSIMGVVQVEGRNARTASLDLSVATESGSFVLELSDSLLGDEIAISISAGDEFSDPASVELDSEADGPPRAGELRAVVTEGTPGVAAVSAAFPTEHPLDVVIANVTTGQIHRVATNPSLEPGFRELELLISAEVGDELTVYAIELERELPGPLARTEVVLL